MGWEPLRDKTDRKLSRLHVPARADCPGTYPVVRFPLTSKPFGSAAKLTASMLAFLHRYAHLTPDVAAVLVAFAVASWFVDCVSVAPILLLLGPDNEVNLILRCLGCLCRRPVLLTDIDVPALATSPIHLDPTLLISQRDLARWYYANIDGIE